MLDEKPFRIGAAALACSLGLLLSACSGGSDDKKPRASEKAPAAQAAEKPSEQKTPRAAEAVRRIDPSARSAQAVGRAEARPASGPQRAERPVTEQRRQAQAPRGGEQGGQPGAAPAGSVAGTPLERSAAALNLPKPHPDVLTSRLFLGPEKPVLDVRPAAEKEIADAYGKARK